MRISRAADSIQLLNRISCESMIERCRDRHDTYHASLTSNPWRHLSLSPLSLSLPLRPVSQSLGTTHSYLRVAASAQATSLLPSTRPQRHRPDHLVSSPASSHGYVIISDVPILRGVHSSKRVKDTDACLWAGWPCRRSASCCHRRHRYILVIRTRRRHSRNTARYSLATRR